MASATIRVVNLRENLLALNKVEKEAGKEVRDALKKSVQPVVGAARSKLSVFEGASVGTIGSRASVKGVFVTQRARKVSSLRPDFGSLQMQRVLIPALYEHVDSIMEEVDDALNLLGRKAGF